jgi:hypothetical protein
MALWKRLRTGRLLIATLDCGSLLPLFRGSPAAAEVSWLPKSLLAGANAGVPWQNIVLEHSTASRLASEKRQQAAAVHVMSGLAGKPMNPDSTEEPSETRQTAKGCPKGSEAHQWGLENGFAGFFCPHSSVDAAELVS